MSGDAVVGLAVTLGAFLLTTIMVLVISFFNQGPIAPGLVGPYVRMCARGQAADDSESHKLSMHNMSDLKRVSTRLRPRHYRLAQRVYDRRLRRLNRAYLRHTTSMQHIDDIRNQQLRLKSAYEEARREIR